MVGITQPRPPGPLSKVGRYSQALARHDSSSLFGSSAVGCNFGPKNRVSEKWTAQLTSAGWSIFGMIIPNEKYFLGWAPPVNQILSRWYSLDIVIILSIFEACKVQNLLIETGTEAVSMGAVSKPWITLLCATGVAFIGHWWSGNSKIGSVSGKQFQTALTELFGELAVQLSATISKLWGLGRWLQWLTTHATLDFNPIKFGWWRFQKGYPSATQFALPLPRPCHGVVVVTPAPQLVVFSFGWAILNAGLCVPSLPVAIASQVRAW